LETGFSLAPKYPVSKPETGLRVSEPMKLIHRRNMERQPSVAILDWSHLLEDFVDHLGVSFEAFRNEFMGSWIFGYAQALRSAGVQVELFYVSARVKAPWRFIHIPSKASVCVLPAPWAYRAVRRRILNPYAPTLEQAAGTVHGMERRLFVALKELAPYLATPLRQLARELRQRHCGVLLCQEYEHARFDACVLLGRMIRIPVFATFQGGDWQLSRLERPLRPLALAACAGLVIATQTEARRVSARYGVPAQKMARIFNPIDLSAWHPSDRAEARNRVGLPLEAQVVVWHGRVDFRRKGLDVLLEAWQRVRRCRTERDLRLVLLGTGHDASGLRERIAAMPSAGVLWLDAFVRDRSVIREYLSAADVYAFPSRHEGFAVAPVEAMACGLPVVAADAPGVPDLLEGEEDSGGLVVPRGDAAAFASALGRMLDDRCWARRLGERARARVEGCFSIEAVGKQLRAFLFKKGSENGTIYLRDPEPEIK
jgi:glycosyltransferase involved in cell wall biosynthesis